MKKLTTSQMQTVNGGNGTTATSVTTNPISVGTVVNNPLVNCGALSVN